MDDLNIDLELTLKRLNDLRSYEPDKSLSRDSLLEFVDVLMNMISLKTDVIDAITEQMSVTVKLLEKVRPYIGLEFSEEIQKNAEKAARTSNAILALNVRHAENRSMKKDVFSWLDTNMVTFASMDKAAETITKLQPISFRTAREWVKLWKKERSTSRP